MDFFGDPNLFEGLAQDCFNSGSVSLADELDLGSGFDPPLINPVGAEKHPGMVANSVPSANPPGVHYSQSMGQFDGMKVQTSMPQSFSNSGGDHSVGGTFLNQQSHFQEPSMNQVSQTNGLYPSNSPIWGEQRVHHYHQHLQQHQQQLKQQLHQHQIQQQLHHHQGQQQHQQHPHQYNHQHSHLQQSQQIRQHQLPAQHQMPHQQINAQTVHQHTNFYYHGPSNVPSHQGHHSSLNPEGSPFHPGADSGPRSRPKVYPGVPIVPTTSEQRSRFQLAQELQGFSSVSEAQDNNLGFHVQSSPETYVLSSCSANLAPSFPPSQYSFPGHPPAASNASQPLSVAPVTLTTTTAAIASGPDLGGQASNCPFLSDPLMEQQRGQIQVPRRQQQECPFSSLQTSKPTQQDTYGSSQMFSEGLDSFSATNGCLSQQDENHANTSGSSCSGFQGLDETLMDHQAEEIDGIAEGHDLLGDELLPQLEAFVQEESSSRSWTSTKQDETAEEDVERDKLKKEPGEDLAFERSLPSCYESNEVDALDEAPPQGGATWLMDPKDPKRTVSTN